MEYFKLDSRLRRKLDFHKLCSQAKSVQEQLLWCGQLSFISDLDLLQLVALLSPHLHIPIPTSADGDDDVDDPAKANDCSTFTVLPMYQSQFGASYLSVVTSDGAIRDQIKLYINQLSATLDRHLLNSINYVEEIKKLRRFEGKNPINMSQFAQDLFYAKRFVRDVQHCLYPKRELQLIQVLMHDFEDSQRPEAAIECRYSKDVKFTCYPHNRELVSRKQEVPYQREKNDELEKEAYRHRSCSKRYSTFKHWKRSLKLGHQLAQLGFYYMKLRFQKYGNHDSICCAFCRQIRSKWWRFEYPETPDSLLNRPTDSQLAADIARWHTVQSPTCPRVHQLQVDAIELTKQEAALIYASFLTPYSTPQLKICDLPANTEQVLQLALNSFNIEERDGQKMLSLDQKAQLTALMQYETLVDLSTKQSSYCDTKQSMESYSVDVRISLDDSVVVCEQFVNEKISLTTFHRDSFGSDFSFKSTYTSSSKSSAHSSETAQTTGEIKRRTGATM